MLLAFRALVKTGGAKLAMLVIHLWCPHLIRTPGLQQDCGAAVIAKVKRLINLIAILALRTNVWWNKASHTHRTPRPLTYTILSDDQAWTPFCSGNQLDESETVSQQNELLKKGSHWLWSVNRAFAGVPKYYNNHCLFFY